MTRANIEQIKHTPWFAKAGAACSIVPVARFIGPNIFALKGGGYGCLFALAGIDEEGLTDQELDSRMRSIEGALRGLPQGSCLYQYTRVMSGNNSQIAPAQRADALESDQAKALSARLDLTTKIDRPRRRVGSHSPTTLSPEPVADQIRVDRA